MTQSDLEWPRTAMEIVWMTQYDFKWVKSTSASPFWGPSDLDMYLDIQRLGDISERDHHTVPLFTDIFYGITKVDIFGPPNYLDL